MRIVNRETFLGLPAGTVFSKYEPCVFDDIAIKGESSCGDFLVQSISGAIECCSSEESTDFLFRAAETGEDLPIDMDVQGRDGMFDDKQLFAVYSQQDVLAIIRRFAEALEEQGKRRVK